MNTDLFREERMLLALLLGQQTNAESLVRGCDWARVGALAERDSVGGYLHRKLQTSGLGRLVPPALLTTLAAAYRKAAFDNLLLLGRMREAAGALAAAHVPCIVLKGGALLADLYPDPGVRSLADIDMLVPAERAAEARRALEALGWTRGIDHQIAARRCSYSTPQPGLCTFEIHWDLSQRYRFQADLAGVWRDRRPFALEGVSASRLGDADEFLYLALHYAAHYFGLTVKWLVDLVELIRLRPPDWDDLGRRARRWKGSAALHAAMNFLARSAPDLVTPEIVARTGRHPIIDRMLAPYVSPDPLRYLKVLPYGPKRLLLAALLQDSFRDRLGLAWLTQVRGHDGDDHDHDHDHV
jgi:hypothetical protein